jgi:hypothetical protein
VFQLGPPQCSTSPAYWLTKLKQYKLQHYLPCKEHITTEIKVTIESRITTIGITLTLKTSTSRTNILEI